MSNAAASFNALAAAASCDALAPWRAAGRFVAQAGVWTAMGRHGCLVAWATLCGCAVRCWASFFAWWVGACLLFLSLLPAVGPLCLSLPLLLGCRSLPWVSVCRLFFAFSLCFLFFLFFAFFCLAPSFCPFLSAVGVLVGLWGSVGVGVGGPLPLGARRPLSPPWPVPSSSCLVPAPPPSGAGRRRRVAAPPLGSCPSLPWPPGPSLGLLVPPWASWFPPWASAPHPPRWRRWCAAGGRSRWVRWGFSVGLPLVVVLPPGLSLGSCRGRLAFRLSPFLLWSSFLLFGFFWLCWRSLLSLCFWFGCFSLFLGPLGCRVGTAFWLCAVQRLVGVLLLGASAV